MKTVEINLDMDLSDEEKARVELHSFHNVLNVIYGELQIIQKIMEDKGSLASSMDAIDGILAAFHDPALTLARVEDIEGYRDVIKNEISAALENHSVSEERQAMLDESLAHLDDILGVVDVRVREILARQQAPSRWICIPCKEVIERMQQVFNTIAAGSRGKYGIVYDEKDKDNSDYLLSLQVQSVEGTEICLPAVLLDSFRDLTANARKYTDPGGHIEAALSDEGEKIKMVISDDGRGIPEDEIASVVGYGKRGSNTQPQETKGGGYGLTKAYFVSRQFGGKMWIASAPGEGTTVTIEIPKPEEK